MNNYLRGFLTAACIVVVIYGIKEGSKPNDNEQLTFNSKNPVFTQDSFDTTNQSTFESNALDTEELQYTNETENTVTKESDTNISNEIANTITENKTDNERHNRLDNITNNISDYRNYIEASRNVTAEDWNAACIVTEQIVEEANIIKNSGIFDNELYYAYSQLTESEKEFYRQLYSLIEHKQANEELICSKDLDIPKVYEALLMDNPEIFYTKSYFTTTYSNTVNGYVGTTISVTYTMSKEDIEYYQGRLYATVNDIIDKAPDTTDYDKIKYFYDYLVQKIDYDYDYYKQLKVSSTTEALQQVYEDNYNYSIISVFKNHKSVCQGYSKSFQYLCQLVGIPCIYVVGFADNSENVDLHAWNLVKVDNNWYVMDVTWGDEEEGWNYNYFCVTSDMIQYNHRADMFFELPDCVVLEDNYYVKEGLYFEELDKDKLAFAFSKPVNNKVSIKCANRELYNELFNYLITNFGAYNYIPQSDTLSYIPVEDLNILNILI